jgi:hypothetical protein
MVPLNFEITRLTRVLFELETAALNLMFPLSAHIPFRSPNQPIYGNVVSGKHETVFKSS